MRHLVLGGARSGKSRFALTQAAAGARPVVFIATATAGDAEMAERIGRHRQERPDHWQTVEEPFALADALVHAAAPDRCVVVDCLTLWLANLLDDEARLDAERGALLAQLPALPGDILLVSNEVGLGLVPATPLGRRFRDEQGRLNQALAALCERVTFVAAGLPLVLKASDKVASDKVASG